MTVSKRHKIAYLARFHLLLLIVIMIIALYSAIRHAFMKERYRSHLIERYFLAGTNYAFILFGDNFMCMNHYFLTDA